MANQIQRWGKTIAPFTAASRGVAVQRSGAAAAAGGGGGITPVTGRSTSRNVTEADGEVVQSSGFHCPVCFAELLSQDELIEHANQQHSDQKPSAQPVEVRPPPPGSRRCSVVRWTGTHATYGVARSHRTTSVTVCMASDLKKRYEVKPPFAPRVGQASKSLGQLGATVATVSITPAVVIAGKVLTTMKKVAKAAVAVATLAQLPPEQPQEDEPTDCPELPAERTFTFPPQGVGVRRRLTQDLSSHRRPKPNAQTSGSVRPPHARKCRLGGAIFLCPTGGHAGPPHR